MPRERTNASTAIILFADIVDSTALTERMGDAEFRRHARRLDGALRTIIRNSSGEAIEGKLLGDGVLAVFSSAERAIHCAIRCGAEGASTGLPLHLGVHAGDVIRESNNVFGGAVNIAARIAGASPPGEVLVSDTVRGLARTSTNVLFEDRGAHEFKGVGEPMRIYRAQVRRKGIALSSPAKVPRRGGIGLNWIAAGAFVAIVLFVTATAVVLAVGRGENGNGDRTAPAVATSLLTIDEQAVRLKVVRTEEESAAVQRGDRTADGSNGILYDGIGPPATSDTSGYDDPVDLVWLDREKQVLEVHSDVGGNDEVVVSPPGARYSLELSGGTASRLGIEVGQAINVYTATTITAADGELNAEVACLEKEMREIGHVGRAPLPEDGGLLYNWRNGGSVGWSTAGYLFAIDIVWLDQQKTVIDVLPDVQPGRAGIPPPEAMYYVIETNAGAAERFGLTTGAVAAFDVPCDPE